MRERKGDGKEDRGPFIFNCFAAKNKRVLLLLCILYYYCIFSSSMTAIDVKAPKRNKRTREKRVEDIILTENGGTREREKKSFLSFLGISPFSL